MALAASIAAAASNQQNLCQPNPSPVDPVDPSIIVSSPTNSDSVTSPITVTGQARTFEANVQLALFDADGHEIAATFTTAGPGEIGFLAPFNTSFDFSVAAPTDACLWVFEQSAQTGDPINVVQIALTLQPAGLPSTGGAAPDAGDGLVWPLVATLAALGASLAAAGLLLRGRTA